MAEGRARQQSPDARPIRAAHDEAVDIAQADPGVSAGSLRAFEPDLRLTAVGEVTLLGLVDTGDSRLA